MLLAESTLLCALRRRAVASLLGLLAAMAGAGCARPSKTASEIRIGLIVSAEEDPTIVAAARMAVDAVNWTGGLRVGSGLKRVALVVGDSPVVSEAALAAAQRLINREGVVAFVGPYGSREAIPVARLAEKAAVPMMAPLSTSPETTASKRYVFRVCFSDARQGTVLARFARDELRARRAALLYDVAQDYSRGLAEIFRKEFETRGGKTVASETFTTDREDFEPLLRRILPSHPEVLFLPGRATPVALEASQARRVGLEATLLGVDAWDYAEFARPEFEGSYLTCHWSPDSEAPESQAFVARFKRGQGTLPKEPEAVTFDAFGLLFEAMRRQGASDPESIRAGLSHLTGFRGVTGRIDYAGSGDPRKAVLVAQMIGGRTKVVRQVDPEPEEGGLR